MFLVMMNLLSNFIFFILIVVIVISIFARWRERIKFINLPMESLLFQPFYCNSWSVLCYEAAVLTVLFRWFIALVSPSKDEILIFFNISKEQLVTCRCYRWSMTLSGLFATIAQSARNLIDLWPGRKKKLLERSKFHKFDLYVEEVSKPTTVMPIWSTDWYKRPVQIWFLKTLFINHSPDER